MSAWPGKSLIGLTGNIATGKSVVRKMLEHLGAYGIDADALAHRAIAKGSPGYQPVLDTFGTWVLANDGQIDRTKLAGVVFTNFEAMQRLEAIVHPLVGKGVDILIRHSKQKVIVIEAIKLLESGMANKCDSIWVTYAPQELQLARLMQKRSMSEVTARQRIDVQPLQEKKVAIADVVIRNDGSFESTWEQVTAAWKKHFPTVDVEALPAVETVKGEISIHRARPREAGEIASLINRLSEGQRNVTQEDIMAAFGEKAFLLLCKDEKALGIVGWKVENLVASTDDVYLDSSFSVVEAMSPLMNEVERASRELQCEISLIFLPPELIGQDVDFSPLGYQIRTVNSLGVRAWEEAAQEAMPTSTIMLFKQLRQDRVFRPV